MFPMNVTLHSLSQLTNTHTDNEIQSYTFPDYLTVDLIDENILYLPHHEILQTSTGTVFIYDTSNTSTTKAIQLAKDNNLSYVDFVPCLVVLRNVWNINASQELLIAQIEMNRTNVITNKIDYMIFKENGEELDLSVCSSLNLHVNYYIKDISNISYDLAKSLNEKGIDIYDGRDDFFNDFCMNFTSEFSTDVVINDRKNYYFKNISYCEKWKECSCCIQ